MKEKLYDLAWDRFMEVPSHSLREFIWYEIWTATNQGGFRSIKEMIEAWKSFPVYRW